ASIEATGKTGLWADPAGVCAQGSKDGVMIFWNVKDSGADKVDVNVVTKEGDERLFGTSGPVGSKASGRWVRPGRVFKIRDSATGKKLGSLTVGDASCWPRCPGPDASRPGAGRHAIGITGSTSATAAPRPARLASAFAAAADDWARSTRMS